MHQKRIVAVCFECVALHKLSVEVDPSNGHESECYLCPPDSGHRICVLLAKHQVLNKRRRPRASHLTNSLGHLFDDPFVN